MLHILQLAQRRPIKYPLISLALLALVGSASAQYPNPWPARDTDCAIAAAFHPNSRLAEYQDYEIRIDPDDPQQNLIYVSNVTSVGPEGSDVYIMRMDARTGLRSGTPLILSDRYTGRARVNGPEFIESDSAGLGILFAGPQGVHATWRSDPTQWDSFDVDLFGKPYPQGSPPPLPGTQPGRHPKDSQPAFVGTYAEIDFETHTCSEACYGYLDGTATTDVQLNLRDTGQARLFRSIPHPLKPGFVIFTGCMIPTEQPTDCGLFQIRIDGAGGVEADTFQQLYAYDRPRMPSKQYHMIQIQEHPGTGELMVFVLHGQTLNAWVFVDQYSTLEFFGQLTDLPRGQLDVEDASRTFPNHLRLIPGKDVLYAEFFLRSGDAAGAYLSVVDNQLNPPRRISSGDPSGAELVYLPAADKLALFLPKTLTTKNGISVNAIERCWVH